MDGRQDVHNAREEFFSELHHFDACDNEAFALKTGDNIAYKAAFYGRGFEDYECLLHEGRVVNAC